MPHRLGNSAAPPTVVSFTDASNTSGSDYLAAALRTCLRRLRIRTVTLDARRFRDSSPAERRQTLQALGADFALVIGCQLCGPDSGEALLDAARTLPTCWWLVDEPRTSSWTVRFSPAVAVAACHSAAAAERHAANGAHTLWLPLGAVPAVTDRTATAATTGSDPAYEVGFAGALNNPVRERLVQTLDARFRLGTLLAWNNDADWLRFVRNCRTVVVPPGWCDDPVVGDGHSLHSYNLAAAGIPQLTVARPRSRPGDGLDNVPCYATETDLCRQLEARLADTDAGRSATAALRDAVLAQHTLQTRAGRLTRALFRHSMPCQGCERQRPRTAL